MTAPFENTPAGQIPPNKIEMKLIFEVKNMDELSHIGNVFEYTLTIASQIEMLKELQRYGPNANLPTKIAIAMCFPIRFAPNDIYTLTYQLLKENLAEIPLKYHYNLVMRLVSSALFLNLGVNLYNDSFFKSLVTHNLDHFSFAFLFLSSMVNLPIDLFESQPIPYSHIPRQDLLTLYYYSINLLLLKNEEKTKKAEKYLMYALELAKATKSNDIISSVIEKLSVASFLNHVPYSVFLKRIPKFLNTNPVALSIWDLDTKWDPKIDKTLFYQKLQNEIRNERTIRIIYDFAKSTSQIKLSQLQMACGTPDIQSALVIIESIGDIQFVLNDDEIKFTKYSIQSKVESEQKEIDQLYEMINVPDQ